MDNDKKVAHRLKDRFAGKEQEILQSLRVHGSIATMILYEVSDYVWESTSIVPSERELSVNVCDDKNRLFLGNFPNHRQLAGELVEAFTDKVGLS